VQVGCDAGPCRQPALDKGPWVMRTDDSHASIFWETQAQPSCVAAGLTAEAGGAETIVAGAADATTVQSSYGEGMVAMPDLAGTYYLSRVDASGLAPGACYAYRVRQDGASDATGRFCTTRPVDQPIKVLAIGDTDPILGHTAGVLKATLPEKPDFTIHMGDINYYSSTETWAYWFGAMAPMLRAGAFFPAVGNHENETMYEPTDFADYYDRLFHQPSLDGTPAWYRFESGGVWFHTVDTEQPYDSASPQYAWLVDSLMRAAAQPGFRFSVVFMHRNLYTLGDASPNVDVRMALAPIFEANKVRLVLSGHMHGYERFEVGDITYVTTAGGGGTINDVNGNVANYPMDVPLRVAVAAKYHATIFDVTPMGSATLLHGRAIDEFGQTFDDFMHVIP
jgi:hypothetical protein